MTEVFPPAGPFEGGHTSVPDAANRFDNPDPRATTYPRDPLTTRQPLAPEVILGHIVRVLRALLDGRSETGDRAIRAALVALETEVGADVLDEVILDAKDARIAELEAQIAGKTIGL